MRFKIRLATINKIIIVLIRSLLYMTHPFSCISKRPTIKYIYLTSLIYCPTVILASYTICQTKCACHVRTVIEENMMAGAASPLCTTFCFQKGIFNGTGSRHNNTKCVNQRTCPRIILFHCLHSSDEWGDGRYLIVTLTYAQ